jgi:hypothetical protein
VDRQLAHILTNAFFSGVFEFVEHDMPREKAEVYVKSLKEFYAAGWLKILNLEE